MHIVVKVSPVKNSELCKYPFKILVCKYTIMFISENSIYYNMEMFRLM